MMMMEIQISKYSGKKGASRHATPCKAPRDSGCESNHTHVRPVADRSAELRSQGVAVAVRCSLPSSHVRMTGGTVWLPFRSQSILGCCPRECFVMLPCVCTKDPRWDRFIFSAPASCHHAGTTRGALSDSHIADRSESPVYSRAEPALFTPWGLGTLGGLPAGLALPGPGAGSLRSVPRSLLPRGRGPTNLPVSDPELACRDDTRAVCVVGPLGVWGEAIPACPSQVSRRRPWGVVL